MARGAAVLILEAKDNATALLKAFGGAVQDAGQKADKASAGVARTGVATKGLIERLKAAQMPLRNLSAVLSGFGLSFLGITAATMALRGMVSAIIQNQQSLVGAQINMRRWGLTMDDATRLTNTFSAVLGRTAGTTLAAISEDMVKFLLLFGPEERAEILKWAGDIEKASGGLITVDQALKDTAEAERLLGQGKGLAQLKERGEAAARSIPELAKSYERGMNVLKFAFGTLAEGFVRSFDPEFHKQTLGEIVKIFKTFGTWVKEDFAKGLELDLSAPVPKAVIAMADAFKWFGEEVGGIGKNITFVAEGIASGWASHFQEAAKRWQEIFKAFGDYIWGWGIWAMGFFGDIWGRIVKSSVGIWVGGFLAPWIKIVKESIAFWVDRWTALGEWWGKLITGIANFWRGVWEGMKGVGVSVSNFIVDQLNYALAWANTVIQIINSALGRMGIRIPEITLRIARFALPPPEAITPAPMFTAPAIAPGGGGNIIIPVNIGEKHLTEIIIDTLTGAVRQRELSE